MPAYKTLDYLPDLSSSEMASAQPLSFAPYTPNSSLISWDNRAGYYTSADYAILRSTFSWTGKAGATYDIFSSSYFDPYLIEVYDYLGNVVAIDTESYTDTYGSDYVWDFVAPYSGIYYVSAGWNQGYASSHKFVSLSIYEDVDTAKPVSNYINGTAGKDLFNATDANDVIDGGSGTDTVIYSGQSSQYKIVITGTTMTVTGASGTDTLTNIERIQFADKTVAYDATGNAGQAFRLYRAALDRLPDQPGLGAQIGGLDRGMSLLEIAQNFMNSPEFQAKYGVNLTNNAFVNQLYANVLHRTPDEKGFADQVYALDHGYTRAQLLVNFSESTENQAALIGVIQNGMEFIG